MPTIDVLRPDTLDISGDWDFSSSGFVADTSDDSDATYAESPDPVVNADNPSFLFMFVDSHTPSADHERHRIRARARAQAPNGGTLSIGLTVDGQGIGVTDALIAPPTSSVSEFSGPWSSNSVLGLGAAGAITPRFDLRARQSVGSSAAMRINEAYIDVDTRHKPEFTADVYDAGGTSRDAGTISDTNRPRIAFEDLDYDNLAARSWVLSVYVTGSGIVHFEASGSGAPPSNILTDPLPDGDYTADLQIFSTIRQDDAFASEVEQVTFEVDFEPPPPPEIDVTVDACDEISAPHAMVCWEPPTPESGDTQFDDTPLTQIQRIDCNGRRIIAVYPETEEACHCDRFMALLQPDDSCGGGESETLLRLSSLGFASTPDNHTFSGAIDVRALIAPLDWGSASPQTIAAQFSDPNQYSWRFAIVSGDLHFTWSDDGSTAPAVSSTVPISSVGNAEPLYVRVTHLPDDGSGSRETTFFTSTDGISWDQLGSVIVFGSDGTLHDSTANVRVGRDDSGGQQLLGDIFWVEIRDGIDGTVVYSPDFTDHNQGWAPGIDQGTDGQSNVWTLTGAAEIAGPCTVIYQVRYWGEVSGVLVATEWTFAQPVEVPNPQHHMDWLRGPTFDNELGLDIAICPDRSYSRTRPFAAFQRIEGGIPTVITGQPTGRNYQLTFPVTSERDLDLVEEILSKTIVFYQPADQRDLWMAPDADSVDIVKVGRIREVTVGFTEVEAEPVVDPQSFF